MNHRMSRIDKKYHGHISKLRIGGSLTKVLNDLGFELGKKDLENC